MAATLSPIGAGLHPTKLPNISAWQLLFAGAQRDLS